MASIIKVKRSAVSGNAPNTQTLDTAELAINTADGILYSANATAVFEVGANLTSIRIGDSNVFEANSTGGLQVNNNTQINGTKSLIFNNFDYGNTAYIKSDTADLIITNENDGGHTVMVGAGIDVRGNVFANGDSSQIHVGNSTVNVVASAGDLDTTGNVDVGGILTVNAQVFPSEDGGTGQILKTYGNGTLYWTNEAGAAGFSAFTLYEFTATNGQTNFAGNDDNSQSLGYRTADSIQVYLNGILLEDTQDYTATNGANVILTSAASTDDFLQIFSYGIASSNNITIAPNNNIGIANTEPAHLLSVNGQGFFSANVKFGDTILDNSDRQLKIYYANGDVAWGE